MSAASMKRTTAATILDAPKSSVYAQILKDIDKATSHPEPAVASHARNLAATNLIQGRITCSSTLVESMDDVPISINADSGFEYDLFRISTHHNIGVDDDSAVSDAKSAYAPRCPSFIFRIDEICEDKRARLYYPCSIAGIWVAQNALLFEDDVNPNFRTPPPNFLALVPLTIPTFRTPPSSFAYSVHGYRGHKDEVIPTFRGPSNEKHSLPLYFWSHHPLRIHRLGVG
jgi:hypothetical protein